jgi:transcriptional regulator with XRE-family HTH domain
MTPNIDISICPVNRHLCLPDHRAGYNFDPMNYGERLKAAREYAVLDQYALAEKVGIKQPSISYLESSPKAEGSQYTVQFARACGVSPDWLADEIGEMIPTTYQTTDPKIIAVARVMEPMPEYAKDAAVKDVAEVAELVSRARQDGNGTTG